MAMSRWVVSVDVSRLALESELATLLMKGTCTRANAAGLPLATPRSRALRVFGVILLASSTSQDRHAAMGHHWV